MRSLLRLLNVTKESYLHYIWYTVTPLAKDWSRVAISTGLAG